MLYENYHNKISRLSLTLAKVVKYLALIITVSVIVATATVTLLATKGLPGDVDCTTEVTYGDPLQYDAQAFLSDVRYEFKYADSDVWIDTAPHLPGTYQIRAVGLSSFGNDRYGQPTTFVIRPRPIRVWTAEEEILFGNVPTAAYDSLLEGDQLICDGFIYDDITASSTQVTPVLDKIHILDANGNDVTQGYDIEPVSSTITFQKRPLTVTVGSSSSVYDGTPLSFDQYEIAAGSTLGADDSLTAVFSASLTNAGSIDNTSQLTIYHWQDGNAVDVTHQYALEVVAGTLTVEKRPLYIGTESTNVTYNGTAQSFNLYALYAQRDGAPIDAGPTIPVTASPLLEGHKLVCSASSFIDAGSYENVFNIRIVDEQGQDVTDNYAIHTIWGTIHIDPKPVTITTEDCTWTYDGTAHSHPQYKQNGLLDLHQLIIDTCSSILDAGETDNRLKMHIADAEGNDVTKNYTLNFTYGKLVIEKYAITVQTASQSWIYDALPHSDHTYTHGELPAGHWISLLDPQLVTITNAGERKNDLEIGIYNQENDNATSNFDITYEYGMLTVTKRPITVRTGSQSWIYDGKSHDNPVFTIENLVSGHFDMINSTIPSITDAGDVQNSFTVTITDPSAAHADVTDNYEITYEYGTLTVAPRPITIKTHSFETIYDGQTYDFPVWEIISELTLIDGHYLNTLSFSSIQNVGTIDNKIDCQILDNNQVDQTRNYAITWDLGTLKITPRPIGVCAKNVEKVYDGTPLIATDYYTHPYFFTLVEGHILTASVTGSRTELGTSPATPDENSIKITDQNGEDVTDNYDLHIFDGSVIIRPIRIVVVSNSDAKYYDGMPLTNSGYTFTVVEGRLLDGHSLHIEVFGSITNPGVTPNTICATIVDQDGNPIQETEYYEFDLVEGQLTVLSREGGGSGEGGGSVGGGFLGNTSGNNNAVFGQIKNDRDGLLYLRQNVYGDFTGRNWNRPFSYGKMLPNELGHDDLSYNYLTTLALINSGANLHIVQLQDMLLSMLPYYMGLDGNYVMPRDDISFDGNTGSFTLSYYDLPNISGGFDALRGHLGEYAPYEEAYREFVYKYYLTVDNETRNYMQGIIDAEGFTLSDPSVVYKIARYIQNAATYSTEYDQTMDIASNVVIAFLDQYKEGKCTHYASAATLLYRSLGIPARYVEGFMINTKKDTFVDIKNPGHAWVEVYIDGVGWIQVEVTGSSSSSEGDLPQEKPTISLTPAYVSKIYDGKPLYPNDFDSSSLLVLQEYLNKGYYYSCSISGQQLEVGRSKSVISFFAIYDPNGVDVTDQFDIQLQEGLIEVFAAEKKFIDITLYQLQQYYDGNPLFYEEGDYSIGLPDGFSITLDLNISLTAPGQLTLSDINGDVGRYAKYTIFHNGNDVTSDYTLRFVAPKGASDDYIPIRVEKRIIQLTTASQTKFDDGTPLTNGTVTISRGSLVSGHTLEATANGMISAPGSKKNHLNESDVRIYNSNGDDVTDCYELEIVVGTLTILDAQD